VPFTMNRKKAGTTSSGRADMSEQGKTGQIRAGQAKDGQTKVESPPEQPSLDKDARKGSLKALFALSAPHLDKFLLAIGCILLMNGAVLLKPWLLKVVIDDLLISGKPQTFLFNLVTMAVAYILVSLLGGVFTWIQVNLVNRAGQAIIHDLRCKVFSTILHLPLPWLDKNSSGRLITRATNDISEIGEFYTDVTVNMMKDILLVVGIVGAMFAMSVKLSLVSLAVIPLMALMVWLIKNRIRKNFFLMKHFIGRINGFTAETLSGMGTIQAFRVESAREKDFTHLNDEYFKTTLTQVRLNSFLKPASDVFQNLAIAMLLAYGIGQVSDVGLPIGVLYAFTSYIKQFFGPISDLADKYNSIQSALVSAERVFSLLDEEPILEQPTVGEPMPEAEGRIEFRNVWFAYNEGEWVLKDVSFVVEPGHTAAFVGETGAGKTTIMSLVSGFYHPQKGDILLDGIPISRMRKADLRRRVATVFQDVFLFAGNIRNNITLHDDTPEPLLQTALEASCTDALVEKLPGGLEEEVTERGSTLSAGQRQLISFARAIAHDPAVLVMDEATANIDTGTERLIQKALARVTEDRTTLTIAHRLSTIRHADRIFVMRHGEIVETGTHGDLLALDGYYASLVDEREEPVA
jgi:ATP-binding cassette, subfamily B, multidrug efflux pump